MSTSPGGVYRLCWCASGFACSTAESFAVDLGSLALQGPSPLTQDRTCISGTMCTIEGLLGQDVHGFQVAGVTGARLAGNSYVTGFQVFFGDKADPMRWMHADCRPATENPPWLECLWPEKMTAAFWTIWIFAAAENPLIKEIQLLVQGEWVGGAKVGRKGLMLEAVFGSFPGPDTTQWLLDDNPSTAWKGDSGPAWQIVLRAYDSDSVVVLDTCGTRSMVQSLGVMPATSMDPAAIGGAPNPSITWPAPITANGGVYRLCWCARGHRCSSTEDFVVDAGSFTVVGPWAAQEQTCISGQTCALEGLLGQHLQDTDRLLILATCGIEKLVPRLSAIPSADWGVAARGSDITTFAIPTAGGGYYRLCWCSSVTSDCGETTEFRTDAGRLTLLGVQPLRQHRTCVSGQACRLRGITGLTSVDNTILALDTCGTFGVPVNIFGAARVYIGSNATFEYGDNATFENNMTKEDTRQLRRDAHG